MIKRFLDSRLSTFIDQANALVFVVDGDRCVDFVNRAMAELLGAAPDSIAGRDLMQWIPEEEQAEFERAFQKSITGDAVIAREMAFLSSRGGVGRGVFSMTALRGPDERVEAVIAIGHDSTAMRVLEMQVIHAEKLATVGQLAAGVVHEINNPLTSISVYSDYLVKKFKRQGMDPADITMLEKILDGSNRILKCARDLVNYAKPSPGHMDVLSLNDVTAQAVSFCEHVIEKHSAQLTTELETELPPVYGVQDRLQQVLINLVTNACHALPPGGGRIWVRTMAVGQAAIAVEVEDNGAGIAIGDLPRIFDPFFTTKTPGQGTGLGLSIVKNIVDSHEGSILVRSEPGKGTTIAITLPTRRRADDARRGQ